MNLLCNRPADPEAAALRERIFQLPDADRFFLDQLLGIVDIGFSDKIPTACIECRRHPRMWFNRGFLREQCADDRDLFLLVMHELYHVCLGHTRVFRKRDELDNIVFDAVVNAMLAHAAGRCAGTGLLERCNPFESFPSRLLRPPPGWPRDFSRQLHGLPAEEIKVIRLLYGPGHTLGGGVCEAGYEELRRLLRGILLKRKGRADARPVLLGSHGPEAEADTDPEGEWMGRLIGNLAGNLPRCLGGRLPGRSNGRGDRFSLRPARTPAQSWREAVARALRRCGAYDRDGARPGMQRRPDRRERPVRSVLPAPRDRRVPALRELLGHEPVFQRRTVSDPFLNRRAAPAAHVYLDASGSMHEELPQLAAVAGEPLRERRIRLFGFSTVVDEIRGPDIAAAVFRNTGGTDIDCVLRHLASLPRGRRPRSALVLTDGYTGKADSGLLAKLRGVRLHALVSSDCDLAEVREWADEAGRLPVLPGT